MKQGIILKTDSRDRHAHIFGQVTDFPPESNFGYDLFSVVEGAEEVSCTAYSTTKIRGSQTKRQYDVNDLWSHVPSSNNGADPKDCLKATISNGLKEFKDDFRDFGIKGYFRGETGSLIDSFDNARSTMKQAESSLMCNSYWYKEWQDTPIYGKMPVGKTPVSAHSYVIVDWKIIDGETVFLIDSHQGQRRYMPRETFNQAMTKYGVSTYMPSTQEVLDKVRKTILQTLLDACLNLYLLLNQKFLALKHG
jgi:hypothetical protein